MVIRSIITLAISLAVACGAAAQEKIAQNKPYIDLRPLAYW